MKKRKPTKPREPIAAELLEVISPIDTTPDQLARAGFRHPPMTQAEVLARVRARKKAVLKNGD